MIPPNCPASMLPPLPMKSSGSDTADNDDSLSLGRNRFTIEARFGQSLGAAFSPSLVSIG